MSDALLLKAILEELRTLNERVDHIDSVVSALADDVESMTE